MCPQSDSGWLSVADMWLFVRPGPFQRQSSADLSIISVGFGRVWLASSPRVFICRDDGGERASLNKNSWCIILAGSSDAKLAAGFKCGAHDERAYDKGSRDISFEPTWRLLGGRRSRYILNQSMDNCAAWLSEVSGRHLVVESQLNVSHLIFEWAILSRGSLG